MTDSASPDLLPGTLHLLILRSLRRGPLHGYAIAQRLRDWSRGGLKVEEGSLYPALNRMLVKGWVKAEWALSDNNRRARFYQLTIEGRRQLERESDAFNRMVRMIQMVLRTREDAP